VIPDCADPTDPQCPVNLGILDSGAITFAFTGSRPDLEQAAYVQDLIRLGNWTVNAGLRCGSLPTVAEFRMQSARALPSRAIFHIGLNIHASYDRIFQTPSFENILLASSPAAEAIDTSVPALRLPVQPSHGNYYELGSHESILWEAAAGCEYVPSPSEQLRRRLPNSEYRDQFPSHLVTP